MTESIQQNISENNAEKLAEKYVDDNGANHSVIKIDAYHCYMCGILFNKEDGINERTKSFHHSIPRFLKPKRNVLIPICIKCHTHMNQYSVQSVPKKPKNPKLNVTIAKIESIKKGMDKELLKVNKALDELNKLKENTK